MAEDGGFEMESNVETIDRRGAQSCSGESSSSARPDYHWRKTMRILFLIPALAIVASPVAAWAEDFTPQDLVCKLEPTACPKKRGVLNTGGAVVSGPPNAADITVNFEYNSSILQNDARINLDKLGAALSSAKLAGKKFRIGGHTDSSGNPRYNQVLSERRAKAVRDYLITRFAIPASDLTAEGYGSSRPALPNEPENAANRRVEVVNLTPAAAN
jgi:outer membrane protein OmpA-like peptidoglycan-associated protein